MGKHAGKRRWLKYPLNTYLHMYKNTWYFFTKPKLRKKINAIKSKFNQGAE